MSKSDPTRRDALPVGTSLREYTLDRVVGHGGFGIVYKASHKELGVAAAIKEYLPIDLAIREGMAVRPRSSSDSLDYEDGLRRFRDEARALMQFRNHPTIVTCREFFQEHGTAYLVMEFEDGLPLAQVLATREFEGRPFEEADLLAVMVPLLEGLRDVHQTGLLHRDIKPSNILIRSRDKRPVLIDFGTAKQLVAKQTKSMAPFTEGYAALEQVADAGELGPWTDLYGVGAVMWRMVAGGQRPWEPPHPVRVERRSHAALAGANDPLPPAHQLGKGRFSRVVLDAIDMCLRLRENDRVQTCRDLLHMLRAVESTPAEIMSTKASGQSLTLNTRGFPNQLTHPKLWAFLQSRQIPLVFRLTLGWPLARIKGLPIPLRIIADLRSPDVSQIEELRNAIQDDPLGQFALAEMYESGRGIVEDSRQAEKWYRKSADQGHLQAQYQLATSLYSSLYYVDSDVTSATSAIQWWQLSADNGNLASQHRLAELYESDGARQDHSQSAKWYSKAAAQDHAVSQHRLASHYSFGYGVVEDDRRALKWHKKAAAMGHAESQHALGENYYHGRLVSEDRAESAKWYRKSAEQGDGFSQHMIGTQYFHGRGVDQDAHMAAFWLNKAANYFQLDERFYREICPDTLAECYLMLGNLYETGRGVPKDEVIAYKWYHLSADCPQEDSNPNNEFLSKEELLDLEDLEEIRFETEIGLGVGLGYEEEYEDDQEQYYTHDKALSSRTRIANSLTKAQLSRARRMVLDHQQKPNYPDLQRQIFDKQRREVELFSIQSDTRVVPFPIPSIQPLKLDSTKYRLSTRARIRILAQVSKFSKAWRTLLCWPLTKVVGLDTSMRLIRDLDPAAGGFTREALAAVLGDASAQYEIGIRYAAGEAVMPNPWEAARWIRRSAAQGHAGAQFFLGFLFYFGYGVAQNSDQATECYRKAAQQGQLASPYLLGDLSCIGQDIGEDTSEAHKWYICIGNKGKFPPHKVDISPLEWHLVRPESARWYRRLALQNDPWTQYGFAAECARRAEANSDYLIAEKWYRKAAEQGHSEAQYHLAQLYDLGKGVKQDRATAALWYRRAADQGDELAQYRLGTMYCFGEGVEQDHIESETWYRRAAEQGDESAKACLVAVRCGPSAQFRLAERYSSSTPRCDEGGALKWYELAANGGDAKAQAQLGWWYYVGDHVERDYAIAAKWFRKAAEQGDIDAQYMLGMLFRSGDGVNRDDLEAAKWFHKAAGQGSASAQSSLGRSYQYGMGVDRDQVEAVMWYQRAAELGDAGAQYTLGMLFFSGEGVEQDYSEAAKWLRKAAIQGEEEAQYMLGSMYYYGKGVERGVVEAATWLRAPAEQGNSIAQYILGNLYEKGEGVKADYIEAARWYTCSASGNVSEAQFALGEIHELGRGVTQDYAIAYVWYYLAASGELTDSPEWCGTANSIAGPDFSLVNAADGRERVAKLMSWKENQRAHKLIKSREKTIGSDRMRTEASLTESDTQRQEKPQL